MENVFAFPDKIKIERAEFYRLAPIPLPRPFKDGTGGVRTASLFGNWVKLYDTEGICGEGPCTELMLSFFVPILLEAGPMANGELIEKLYWNIRNFGYQSAHVRGAGKPGFDIAGSPGQEEKTASAIAFWGPRRIGPMYIKGEVPCC